MKKVLALLLSVIMLLSLLAGCGQKKPVEDVVESGADENTLTIGIPQNALVEDYDMNAYTLWLEEQTGLDIKFRLYQGAVNDYKAQLSVSMVDGDVLPDMLVGFTLGSNVFNEYGEDGYFIDLAPYFNDKEGKSKAWWDRFSALDEDFQTEILNGMTNDDGESIYVFPTIEWSDNDVMNYQVLINQDWLTALNLPMPTNPDELYDTLVAFRDKDPNGNGKKDEIPLIGLTDTRTFDAINWLINMFVYNSDDYRFKVDENGKIYHDLASDEYREALIYINKLYKEGLLSSATMTAKSSTLKALMAPGDGVETVGICVGRPTSIFTANDLTLESYASLPYWGNAVLAQQRRAFVTFITEDCKNTDAAWEVLMLMSSEEGAYRQRYGEKGVDWTDADEGALAFTGEPADIKLINAGAFSTINNACWHSVMGTICINSENESVQVDNDGSWNAKKLALMADIYRDFYAQYEKTEDNTVKGLRWTNEEQEEYDVIKTNTVDWLKECRTAFIIGEGVVSDPSDDAQWAQYIAGLEKNGMNEWLAKVQEIYDRTYQ